MSRFAGQQCGECGGGAGYNHSASCSLIARVERTVEHLNTHWRGTLDALAQSEADDWYAAEVERMRERAPA